MVGSSERIRYSIVVVCVGSGISGIRYRIRTRIRTWIRTWIRNLVLEEVEVEVELVIACRLRIGTGDMRPGSLLTYA